MSSLLCFFCMVNGCSCGGGGGRIWREGGGGCNLRRAASLGVLGEAEREGEGQDAGGDSATEEKRGEII